MWGRCSSMRNCVWATRAKVKLSSPATWGNYLARAGLQRNPCINGARLAMTSMLRDSHNRINGRHGELFSSSGPSFRWDSEVFVLRGDDRAQLRQRVQAVADFLARTPGVELKDLAFSLNTTL